MARYENRNWCIPEKVETWEQIGIAVLMDIRDELVKLNTLLRCQNFMAIPFKLDRIARNTTKPRKRRPKTKR